MQQTQRGFVGGTRDQDVGLVHIGARPYDAGLGRFVTVDPLIDPADPQQMNGYIYANNNPLTNSDPTGLIPVMPGGQVHGNDSRNNPVVNGGGAGGGEYQHASSGASNDSSRSSAPWSKPINRDNAEERAEEISKSAAAAAVDALVNFPKRILMPGIKSEKKRLAETKHRKFTERHIGVLDKMERTAAAVGKSMLLVTGFFGYLDYKDYRNQGDGKWVATAKAATVTFIAGGVGAYAYGSCTGGSRGFGALPCAGYSTFAGTVAAEGSRLLVDGLDSAAGWVAGQGGKAREALSGWFD